MPSRTEIGLLAASTNPFSREPCAHGWCGGDRKIPAWPSRSPFQHPARQPITVDAAQRFPVNGYRLTLGQTTRLQPLTQRRLEGPSVQFAEHLVQRGYARGAFPNEPKASDTSWPWSRPHWLMAYRLRAPHSMVHTANPKIAPRGCRFRWALRGSGNRPNTSDQRQPNFRSLPLPHRAPSNPTSPVLFPPSLPPPLLPQ